MISTRAQDKKPKTKRIATGPITASVHGATHRYAQARRRDFSSLSSLPVTLLCLFLAYTSYEKSVCFGASISSPFRRPNQDRTIFIHARCNASLQFKHPRFLSIPKKLSILFCNKRQTGLSPLPARNQSGFFARHSEEQASCSPSNPNSVLRAQTLLRSQIYILSR